jgi:hypothetical protein
MNRSELMRECLKRLKAEYPMARLFDVRVETSLGERSDGVDEDWHKDRWSVQVGNEHGGGDSPELAIEDLRQQLTTKARIPGIPIGWMMTGL